VLIRALATDYDSTLATRGEVHPDTFEALTQLKASGRQLIMVTGRELPDLRRVFPSVELFDAVVAENGALLWRPGAAQAQPLAPPAPHAFVDDLRRRGVEPLAVGRSIVATLAENAGAVAASLEMLSLPWRMIFNKDSVMVLPRGVDKASGLAAALAGLDLAAGRIVGVGDAENDHAFLAECGLAAAVANALPALKSEVDIVTEGEEGAGVAWLIGRLLDGELDALIGQRLSAGASS